MCYLAYSDHGNDKETGYDILTLKFTAARHKPLLKKIGTNGILKNFIRLEKVFLKFWLIYRIQKLQELRKNLEN